METSVTDEKYKQLWNDFATKLMPSMLKDSIDFLPSLRDYPVDMLLGIRIRTMERPLVGFARYYWSQEQLFTGLDKWWLLLEMYQSLVERNVMEDLKIQI